MSADKITPEKITSYVIVCFFDDTYPVYLSLTVDNLYYLRWLLRYSYLQLDAALIKYIFNFF